MADFGKELWKQTRDEKAYVVCLKNKDIYMDTNKYCSNIFYNWFWARLN